MRGPFPVTSATLSARSIASAPMCRRACATLRFRLFRKPCDVCDACRTPPDARHGHFDLDGETSVSAYSRGRHC